MNNLTTEAKHATIEITRAARAILNVSLSFAFS